MPEVTKLHTTEWLSFGIPDQLVVDNGLDLTSYGVREACSQLGIDLLFTPVRSPWYKGTIERFGRTINTRFIHLLPGTTLGKATRNLGYDGKDHATLTFEWLRESLDYYIIKIHNQTPRRNKEGSPERRYLEGIQEWPVRLPLSRDEFDAAVALTRSAKLQQNGLTYLGLHYQNDTLGALWHRLPDNSRRLTLKVNPLDLKTLKVLHPVTREVISVDCVSHVEWPRSLAYHIAVRSQARAANRNPDDLRQLAVAERHLKERMVEAMRDSRKSFRRAHAELYQLSQLHETQESSDMENLAEVVGHEEVSDVLAEVFKDGDKS